MQHLILTFDFMKQPAALPIKYIGKVSQLVVSYINKLKIMNKYNISGRLFCDNYILLYFIQRDEQCRLKMENIDVLLESYPSWAQLQDIMIVSIY